MRNLQLEGEIAAQEVHLAGPLSFWRTLPAAIFCHEARTVEAAVASIVAASRLVPDHLIADLACAVEEERAPVWNELAVRFQQLDRMSFGLLWEIAGSCAALSARAVDPLGLVLLLNRLAQPYILVEFEDRICVAATWLSIRGALLNRTTLSEVDWHQAGRLADLDPDGEA